MDIHVDDQSDSDLFTPERGDTELTAKSLAEIESILREYPPCRLGFDLLVYDVTKAPFIFV